MPNKRIVAAVLAVVFPLTASASVQSSMQGWFNDIGAYGNVTGAAAYQGQTRNLYTGGSLYMRTPVRNYQLATVSPPSFTRLAVSSPRARGDHGITPMPSSAHKGIISRSSSRYTRL